MSSSSFSAIKTMRAFEEICVQIRKEIQSGTLIPGDKLPAERELALQFQVSRSSVREALRALEVGGVVSLKKGAYGGAVILQGDSVPIIRSMEDLLALGGISLADFTEARVCLQSEIIRLACDRATEEDFVALAKNIDEISKIDLSKATDRRLELNTEFYDILANATRNQALVVVMQTFTEPLWYYLRQSGPDTEWDVAASRGKFLVHLRARNVTAAIAEMQKHMHRLHKYLIRKQAEAG